MMEKSKPMPNQSMKPMAHCETTPMCLPRHPAVAYRFLVGR